MKSIRKKPKRIISIARWLGLGWGAFWVLSLGLAAYAEIFVEGKPYEFNEGTIIFLFVLLGIAGVIIGWKSVIIGGVILTIIGLTFSIFGYMTAGHNEFLVIFISGAPFLLSGILFLAGGEYEKENTPLTRGEVTK